MIRIKLKPVRRDPWMWRGSYPAFCRQYLLTVSHQIEIFSHRPWNDRLKQKFCYKYKTPVKSTKMLQTSSAYETRSVCVKGAYNLDLLFLMTKTSIFRPLVWTFHDFGDTTMSILVSIYRTIVPEILVQNAFFLECSTLAFYYSSFSSAVSNEPKHKFHGITRRIISCQNCHPGCWWSYCRIVVRICLYYSNSLITTQY